MAAARTREARASFQALLGDKGARGNNDFVDEHGIDVYRESFELKGETFALLRFHKDVPGGCTQTYFVPHDDEHAAFDAALRIIGERGGTLLCFDSRGHRNLRTESGIQTKQDPNRMFTESSPFWPLAKHVLRQVIQDGKPVITLHNNDPRGSFVRTLEAAKRNRLILSLPEKESKRDIVWIAISDHAPESERARINRIIGTLKEAGVNCALEKVDSTRPTNGSLSQYCALRGIPYFNIEVGTHDMSGRDLTDATERQLTIAHTLLHVLDNRTG